VHGAEEGRHDEGDDDHDEADGDAKPLHPAQVGALFRLKMPKSSDCFSVL
jgi:hypothetical protein